MYMKIFVILFVFAVCMGVMFGMRNYNMLFLSGFLDKSMPVFQDNGTSQNIPP